MNIFDDLAKKVASYINSNPSILYEACAYRYKTKRQIKHAQMKIHFKLKNRRAPIRKVKLGDKRAVLTLDMFEGYKNE